MQIIIYYDGSKAKFFRVHYGNKLDLLLCNYPEIIMNVTTTSPEQYGYPTDHHILEFVIQQNFSRSQPIKQTIFDYEL
jgi:hypothetical protein